VVSHQHDIAIRLEVAHISLLKKKRAPLSTRGVPHYLQPPFLVEAAGIIACVILICILLTSFANRRTEQGLLITEDY
jgi:hypothetical protein